MFGFSSFFFPPNLFLNVDNNVNIQFKKAFRGFSSAKLRGKVVYNLLVVVEHLRTLSDSVWKRVVLQMNLLWLSHKILHLFSEKIAGFFFFFCIWSDTWNINLGFYSSPTVYYILILLLTPKFQNQGYTREDCLSVVLQALYGIVTAKVVAYLVGGTIIVRQARQIKLDTKKVPLPLLYIFDWNAFVSKKLIEN